MNAPTLAPRTYRWVDRLTKLAGVALVAGGLEAGGDTLPGIALGLGGAALALCTVVVTNAADRSEPTERPEPTEPTTSAGPSESFEPTAPGTVGTPGKAGAKPAAETSRTEIESTVAEPTNTEHDE